MKIYDLVSREKAQKIRADVKKSQPRRKKIVCVANYLCALRDLEKLGEVGVADVCRQKRPQKRRVRNNVYAERSGSVGEHVKTIRFVGTFATCAARVPNV